MERTLGILIVEKDNKSAELIHEIFYEDKKDLFFVCDDSQALIAFRKYKISIVIIDLEILLANVFDLIQIMKKENSQIKIIALNSTINNYDIDKYQKEYGFDKLIQKDDIHKYLYDLYSKLINEDEAYNSCNANFNRSLMNLVVFQKAFEAKKQSIAEF